MSDEPTATRRRLLQGAAATGLLYGGIGIGSADEQEPFDDLFGTTASTTGEAGTTIYPPEIDDIRSPLAMNPEIHEGGETLRIELDADVEEPTVTIRPTFGSVQPHTELDAEVTGEETSQLWLDTQPGVTVVEAELPPVSEQAPSNGAPVSPGLYDVAVEWNGGEETDFQPRALSLRREFPDEPRVYVVSDAHAGDPRALATGVESSAEEGNPEPFLFRYENVLGVGTDTERWGGFRRAIAEVSALDPDLVIFPGDLAFGQDTPKKFYQEYADAYAMLSALRAPVYTALGNHDGYIQGTTDGKELYHDFIGPWYWSREVRDGFRLTCIDTYDWAETDRLAVSYGVSAWGGQTRKTQRTRLRNVLDEWYDPGANQTHISFSHHSPAWRADPGNPTDDDAEGVPVAEQLARGVGDFAQHGTGGQAWRGSGRVETRQLLADFDVDLHVSGHAHRDRLSRDLDGEIVYTPDGESALGRYVHADNTDRTDEFTDEELREALLSGDGVLYANTTTAGSGTSQYWGWRFYDLGTPIDPSDFGYQPEDPTAFLEDRAVEPDSWPAGHAGLGRYSMPTFEFDIERIDTDDESVAVRIHNELEGDRSGRLLLSLSFDAPPQVEGGDLSWRRRGDGHQDITIAYDVDSESETVVRVSPPGN